MAGDDKITLQVGGITRAVPVRKAAHGGEQPGTVRAPRPADTPAPVPVARLVSLARELGEQGPPVDHARIAALRNTIASGAYAVDAALIAKAVARFHKGVAG